MGRGSCSVGPVHPLAHRGLESLFADGWDPPSPYHPGLGFIAPRAEHRVRGMETCSQNKCYHNSSKAFLCLSVPGGLGDNEGNVSQAWVTVLWSESHVRELLLRLDSAAASLVGLCPDIIGIIQLSLHLALCPGKAPSQALGVW